MSENAFISDWFRSVEHGGVYTLLDGLGYSLLMELFKYCAYCNGLNDEIIQSMKLPRGLRNAQHIPANYSDVRKTLEVCITEILQV